jgi:sugar transferase (PEP-CTERM/EpsH1 system associated)
MRTRILHVLDNLGNGGLQNGVSNVIDRLDPDRFEHILCGIRPVEEQHKHPFSIDRAQQTCIGSAGALGRTQFPAFVRVIRDWKPHIVHSRNWGAIEAVMASRYTGGCAIVHSEHGIDHDTPDGEPYRRSWFRRFAFEVADRVVCVSSTIANLHAARTGFPKNKIRIIHNGVDDVKFTRNMEVRARIRAELGIMTDEFCIGSVGNLMPVKDYLTTMRALTSFSHHVTKWRMVIAGDGPELNALNTFLEAHPDCRSRVRILGRSKRIAELLNAMDAYVLSSLTEGINNSLLEAMATGLPVVATAAGGNPEVVLHYDCGLMFSVGNFEELADHLLRLYHRQDVRTRLGSQAVRRVQTEFSMSSMVWNYEQLYSSFSVPAALPLRKAVGL